MGGWSPSCIQMCQQSDCNETGFCLTCSNTCFKFKPLIYMGGSINGGIPKNWWFMRENPTNMHALGVPRYPYFRKTPYWSISHWISFWKASSIFRETYRIDMSWWSLSQHHYGSMVARESWDQLGMNQRLWIYETYLKKKHTRYIYKYHNMSTSWYIYTHIYHIIYLYLYNIHMRVSWNDGYPPKLKKHHGFPLKAPWQAPTAPPNSVRADERQGLGRSRCCAMVRWPDPWPFWDEIRIIYHMSLHINVYMYICIYVYMYICIYVYTCIYICICICMYIYIHKYMVV